MKKKVTLLLPGLLSLLLLSWGTLFAAYQVGDVVDNTILDDPYSISHSIYDYEGKIFVFNFWASW
jgi:hypothetical protein